MNGPSFEMEIALGNTGWSPTIIRGVRAGFGAATVPVGDDVLWPIPFPSSAVACQIRGLAVGDTAAGVGVQQVRVVSLDDDGVIQEETVETNGTTAVPLTKPILRCLGLEATRLGTAYGGAANKIFLETVSGASVLASIGKGLTSSLTGISTVPAGMVGLIHQVDFGLKFQGAGNTGELLLWLTQDRDGVRTPGIGHSLFPLRGESLGTPIPLPTPIRVSSLVDVYASTQRLAGGNAGDASITIHMDLIPL